MSKEKMILFNNFNISNNSPFFVIAGPCVIESEDHVLFMAESLKKIMTELKLNFIFKASFDKANRTSINSARGTDIDSAVRIFEKVKKQFDIPIITDIHEPYQVELLKDVIDVIQIPALLCRQTDLLLEAGRSGKCINIKKGQFMSPNDMQNVVEKVLSTGNDRIMLCERGTFFGYNKLVNDFTALPIMKSIGFPVIFDATHSVQMPGGAGSCSGGNREYVSVLAKAAVAVGVSGLFFETHDNPANAYCDGPNMIYLSKLKPLLKHLQDIDKITKSYIL